MDIQQAVTLSDFISGIVSPLVGSFSGVFLAFLLERSKRNQEREDATFEAINHTNIALVFQGNSLQQILNTYSSSDGKNPFLNLKHIMFSFTEHHIDFGKLVFIGESKSPKLLMDLEVAQEGFRYVKRTCELRNRMLDDFFARSDTTLPEFNPETGHVRAQGNPVLIQNFQRVSDILWSNIQMAAVVNQEARDKFLRFSRQQFPKRQHQLVYATAAPPGEAAV
jgi:hypothetical protein